MLAVHEIRDAVLRASRGLDRLDVDLMRSAFLPGATDDHGSVVGDAAAFCVRAVASHQRYTATLHCLSNHLVEVDDEQTARGEVYVRAHLLRPVHGGPPRHDQWFGRYADSYARRDGRWGISHRVCVHEWTSSEEIAEAMPVAAHLFFSGRDDRGVGAMLGPPAPLHPAAAGTDSFPTPSEETSYP